MQRKKGVRLPPSPFAELRLLGESDFDSDFETESSNTEQGQFNVIPAKERWHQCHRCGSMTKFVGPYPYCTECNWDALEDATQRGSEWVA